MLSSKIIMSTEYAVYHVHTMFHEEDTTKQIQFLLQNTIKCSGSINTMYENTFSNIV